MLKELFSMARKRGIFPLLVAYKQSVIIWGSIIFFLPVLIFTDDSLKDQMRCLYVVLLMGVYWVFEALPLAITAFIPMVLFPAFGIMKSEEVAQAYLPDTCFLFMGGLMVALAVEKCQLHARIALFVLKTVGSEPARVMAGFMGVTGFLSMWISNTATTALMVPIVQSVISELVSNHRLEDLIALTEAHRGGINKKMSVGMRRLSLPNENLEVDQTDLSGTMSPRELRMAKGLLLSVCFAANIGGSATITGTASNLVFVGQLEELFKDADTGVNFLSWITFAFPMVLCCLVYCWVVLYLLFLRGAPKGSIIVTRKLQQKYNELNDLSFAEVSVMACFSLLLGLWILREPVVIPGLGDLFEKKDALSDATSAMFVVLLLFVLPEKLPPKRNAKGKYQASKGLLDWETVQDRFPWSVLFLLGGGFALAAGVKESHLSQSIGGIMKHLEVLPFNAIMFIFIVIAVVLTNICSNTVIASIFIPIVAEVAVSLGQNPLNFMLPVTIAASFAFLLPVATPPNAIVFSSGVLKVSDMFFAGLLVTIGCVLLAMANMMLWAGFVYNLHLFPQWATPQPTTTTAPIPVI